MQKKINYLFLLLFIVSNICFAQNEKLKINYGILKTTYSSNSKRISKKEFENIVKSDEVVFMDYSKGRSKIVLGNIVAIPSFFLLLVTIKSNSEGNTPYSWQWIGSVSGSVIGTILYYSGKKNILNSINIYNMGEQTILQLNNNGSNLGIALKF